MKSLFSHETRGWKGAIHRALDVLYPCACAVCGCDLDHGRALCAACAEDLPRLLDPFCHSCGEPFQGQIDGPFQCPNCSDLSFAFEFARPALIRDDRTLDLIHRLKYGREVHLASELGTMAFLAFQDPRWAVALSEKWPLVPVPLHRKRLRHRYFNQAEEIALVLAKHTGLPVLNALRRIRSTETQTVLSRRQRMANLRGAFELTRSGRKRIDESPTGAILLDDVLTTGSTVNECAKILRKGGYSKVFVVTVMRG